MNVSELRAELARRSACDQEARQAVQGWSEDPRTEQWRVVQDVDTDNTRWLGALVREHGWPRRSEVGEAAAQDAWLLAQHADLHPEDQQLFHQLMRAAVEAGEASPALFAYLEDRVRINTGRPQLYGTQFVDHGDGLGPRPIEDPAGLAQRRAAAGLEPFETYEATMHQIWNHDPEP